jgi:hypothetical protein
MEGSEKKREQRQTRIATCLENTAQLPLDFGCYTFEGNEQCLNFNIQNTQNQGRLLESSLSWSICRATIILMIWAEPS